MTESNQNQNLNQNQEQSRGQNPNPNPNPNSNSNEFQEQKTQELKAPRVYWYQKIARSFPASVSVAIGVLLVIALTSGLSAFAGTQAGQGDDNRGKANIEQFDNRGIDKGGSADRNGGRNGDKALDKPDAPKNDSDTSKDESSTDKEGTSDQNATSSDRDSKPQNS